MIDALDTAAGVGVVWASRDLENVKALVDGAGNCGSYVFVRTPPSEKSETGHRMRGMHQSTGISAVPAASVEVTALPS